MFGTVLYENIIALADVFPISCQWKDICVQHPYLQYNLIHCTYKMPCSSSVQNHQHLQSDAFNSDGSLYVNTAATLCDCLCLLGCSLD